MNFEMNATLYIKSADKMERHKRAGSFKQCFDFLDAVRRDPDIEIQEVNLTRLIDKAQ